jgi:hypothetical protein
MLHTGGVSWRLSSSPHPAGHLALNPPSISLQSTRRFQARIHQAAFTPPHPWTTFKTTYQTKRPLCCNARPPPRHSPRLSPRCWHSREASEPPQTLHVLLPSPALRPLASRRPARPRERASRGETLHSAPSRHEVLLSMSCAKQALQPRQSLRGNYAFWRTSARKALKPDVEFPSGGDSPIIQFKNSAGLD